MTDRRCRVCNAPALDNDDLCARCQMVSWTERYLGGGFSIVGAAMLKEAEASVALSHDWQQVDAPNPCKKHAQYRPINVDGHLTCPGCLKGII